MPIEFLMFRTNSYGYQLTIPSDFWDWSTVIYYVHKRFFSLWLPVFSPWEIPINGQVQSFNGWCWKSTQQENKTHRSNRGNEYYDTYDRFEEQCPWPFTKVLDEYGIVTRYTMPSFLNSITKRRNVTFKGMVMCMISHFILPKSL